MQFKTLVLVVVLNALTACSVISSVASYSVTSADIEAGLASQLEKLNQKSSVAGIPVLLSVENLNIEIGPDGRQVVSLLADAKAEVSVFGLSYPAEVKLGIEGEPFYDSNEKAIYVRSLALTRSEIDAAGFKGNLSPVSEKYMSIFNAFLAANPVYRIDTSKGGLAWLATVPLDMSIAQGKIVFTPQLSGSNP